MSEEKKTNLSGQTFCGVVEEAKDRARERSEERRNKPQPWIVLKLVLLITLAIIVYASYVYIARLCVPMIVKGREALGSRHSGIALLVVFSVFFLLALWGYAKVALTSPGYASDHVDKQPRPTPRPTETPTQQHSPSSENTLTAPEPTKSNSIPYSRRPSTTPALLPELRYCSKECIVKPYRTHHCRACGRCVLKYDHHCPWIGQCVGARNHKFFVSFVLWTSIWTWWMFATLLAYNLKPKPPSQVNDDIDPEHIVIMVLSGFFGIFTSAMLVTHVSLIFTNHTTVEQIKLSTTRDHESTLLGEMYHWWEFSNKRAAKRAWDSEWGNLEKEGNIWWTGSGFENWKTVMGESAWGWIFPVGRSLNDGLEYPVNPRFSPEGRQRRRSEWPEELR